MKIHRVGFLIGPDLRKDKGFFRHPIHAGVEVEFYSVATIPAKVDCGWGDTVELPAYDEGSSSPVRRAASTAYVTPGEHSLWVTPTGRDTGPFTMAIDTNHTDSDLAFTITGDRDSGLVVSVAKKLSGDDVAPEDLIIVSFYNSTGLPCSVREEQAEESFECPPGRCTATIVRPKDRKWFRFFFVGREMETPGKTAQGDQGRDARKDAKQSGGTDHGDLILIP